MAEGDILYEKDGDIAVVTINRPERMNSLPQSVWRYELGEIWQEFDADPSVNVAIFTAVGDRAFCAGMDVKEAAEQTAAGQPLGGRGPRLGATPRQNGVRKPVICAVNGLVGGGGLMLVADCDITLAGPNAAFFNPGVGIGVVAMVGQVTWANTMPFHANMRMALMGPHERVDADRALQLGLVTEVVRDQPLLDRAKEIARTIALNSPTAMKVVKQLLWESKDQGLTASQRLHGVFLAQLMGHPDMAEGTRAFAEKRRPNWAPLD